MFNTNPSTKAKPLTLIEHARAARELSANLDTELIERTLPDDAIKVIAVSLAHHANAILNRLPCCAMPLPSLKDQAASEQFDALLRPVEDEVERARRLVG